MRLLMENDIVILVLQGKSIARKGCGYNDMDGSCVIGANMSNI